MPGKLAKKQNKKKTESLFKIYLYMWPIKPTSTICLTLLQQLPGIPTSTFAPCRHCIAPGVSRVSACPRTLPRSLLVPPHCRRSPRRAFYRWVALRWAQNAGAQGYFQNLASCLSSWLCRNSFNGRNPARDSRKSQEAAKFYSFIDKSYATYGTLQRRAYVCNSIRKCAKVNESLHYPDQRSHRSLCTEKQARAAVYILTRNMRVCIREYCCAAKNLGAAWERCQIHASARKSVVLVFHNRGLRAALNTKV